VALPLWRSPLILTIRAQAVPQFVGALFALLLVSVLIPERAGIPLRELAMSPWQALWATSGSFLAGVLDFRFESVESALARRPWTRRLTVACSVIPCALVLVLVSARLSNTSALAGATTVGLSLGLCFLLAVIAGMWTATMGVFVAALGSWIFGLSDDGVSVRAWALLVQPANLLLALAAAGWLVGTAGLWVLSGSQRTFWR
jgi:membrane-associated HD superfamily phosphohydrolase